MGRILNWTRRRNMVRLGVFLIMVALIAGTVGCNDRPPETFAGGSGIASDPYRIANWHHLDNVRTYLSADFILVNDLGSTRRGYEELAGPTANGGKGWDPIGTEDHSFTGAFDGQGYEIRDLFINRPAEDYVGLFGVVGKEGHIEDVGVVNVSVTGGGSVGGLLGRNAGTVSNSYSTGAVTGKNAVGGLVGTNLREHYWISTVSESYSTGSVTGFWGIGGLVGFNEGTVSNSYATDSVTGEYAAGGLVGFNPLGTVSNSYATGSVNATSEVGGLVGGYLAGTVSNSHYNYDAVLINGEKIITIGALYDEDFSQWLAQGRFLDVNERLSQQNGYYVINDVDDFKQLLAFGQDDSLKFRLKTDLDLATEPNFYVPYLAGEFDGNGNKILNLSFNFDSVCDAGLFGYLAPGSKVTQVGAEDVNITGLSNIGGLVGRNAGTVSNSYSTGSVTGDSPVGGLVGFNWGTVIHSYSTGSVTGKNTVGGLVGFTYGGTVSDSYSTGSVTGDSRVGGLVGNNHGGTVSDSYSTGSVTGDSPVGGLVGFNPLGTVSNSYATGSVNATSEVGGLVGAHLAGTVSSSYSTGSVTGYEHVGGLVGVSGQEYGIVSNSFWDVESSEMGMSAGGTGKTTAEMQDIVTFTDTETEGLDEPWNIIAVAMNEADPACTWNIVDTETYPFLSWQPAP